MLHPQGNTGRVWLGAVDNTMIRIMDLVERILKEDKMVKIEEMSVEAKEASKIRCSVFLHEKNPIVL